MRSDGSHMTVKPSQLSVARITAVRGSVIIIIYTTYIISLLSLSLCVCVCVFSKPPMEGSPFIDDYIAHSEQVQYDINDVHMTCHIMW